MKQFTTMLHVHHTRLQYTTTDYQPTEILHLTQYITHK